MLPILLILGLLLLLISAFFIYLGNSLFGGLDFATSSLVANRVATIIKDRHLENGIFLDLGSSRGGLAIRISKKLSKLHISGVDNSHIRTLLAKLKSIFLKNTDFRTKDIFQTNISAADVIYLYLPKELMPGLEVKLRKELKQGGIVISHRVFFPSWQPTQVVILHPEQPEFEKLYIYQNP